MMKKIHLKGIINVISKEKIHIKGILFLVNFQCERFDASEIEALLNYNKIFPLRRFWKSLIIIYTHYYGDEDGESKEEIKKCRTESNSEIFSKLMEKVKEVSDIIEYKNLKIKYFNLSSKPKSEKQKINNLKCRDELEILLEELSQNEPLFHRIEIDHIQNYKLKENGEEYNAEVEIVKVFDFNEEPTKKTINVIKQEKIIVNNYYPPTSCDTYVCKGEKSNDGSLYHTAERKHSDFYYLATNVAEEVGHIAGRAAIVIPGQTILTTAGIAACCAVPVLSPVIAIATLIADVGIGALAEKLFP